MWFDMDAVTTSWPARVSTLFEWPEVHTFCSPNATLPKQVVSYPLSRMTRTLTLLVLLMVAISPVEVKSVELNRDELLAVFIFRLAEHLNWPNPGDINHYNIHLIDEHTEVFDSLRKISRSKTLHGKPFVITRGIDDDLTPGIHLVFISQAHMEKYAALYASVKERPVILIADDLDDHRMAMIDMHDDGNGGLFFEINKANILSRGVSIHPDIILLGGSEIDVAELYKKGQNELKRQSELLKSAHDEVERLVRESGEQRKYIQVQAQALKEMKKKAAELQTRMTSQREMITTLELRSNEEHEKYVRLSAQVSRQEISLQLQQKALQEREKHLDQQQSEIESRKQVLYKQTEKIKEQDAIIAAQGEKIEVSSDLLNSQRQVIWLMASVVMLIMLLTTTLWRSNLARKKTNELLSEQKIQLEAAAHELEKISVTDQLTGLYNRKYLDEAIEAEVDRASRYATKFAVIMVDIDFFKAINDTHGHLTGDKVLTTLAGTLRDNIRDIDKLGRWGGEEFMIICPETDLSGASQLAEKLRSSIEAAECSSVGKRTASFGVASYVSGEAYDDLVRRADSALYQAKEGGRNQVVAETA